VSAEPAITVQGVSKRFRIYHERNQTLKASLMRRRRANYEDFEALKGVSLECNEGETLGIIGGNGSGKSTLLKCITKILRPDAGFIEVRGRASTLLELGAGFHPELSGRENVYLNGSILGLTRKELDRKFDEIVAFAQLERFIDTAVKSYSSGMYVRLGFSVAIHVEPDVLLVDEVLAVGDESFQRRCTEKFFELRAAGKTIVLVSHSMASIRELCDRVAWLDSGVLRRLDKAGRVVDAYLSGVQHDEADHVAAALTSPVSIEAVELLGADGVSKRRVRTGDPITVRLRYSASAPVPKPVFAVDLTTLEGVHVSSPNTRDADQVPDVIEGPGVVELVVDRLLLLPGLYNLGASVTDFDGTHRHDVHHRAVSFEVEPGQPRESHGLVSLAGRWRMNVVE
jgi:ABC-2 type transport system ATP-binding protein